MNFLISFLAYFIIWTAVDYGRKPESKIPIFTKDWLIQLLMVLVGTFIIQHVNEWYPY